MTLKKLITSAAVSAIAAGSLVPLSTAASANEWDHHGRSDHHQYNGWRGNDDDNGRINRWGEHRQYNAWRGNDDDDGGYRHHRNHNGRNLAIGAFAAIIGLAIASEASRGHHYDNGDND